MKKQLTSLIYLGLICPILSLYAIGLNIESYQPTGDDMSAVYGRHAHILEPGWLSLGLTVPYLYRPIEFGDGKDRLPVVDHLLISHWTAMLNFHPYFEPYIRVPLALYGDAYSQNYIAEIRDDFRNYLYLGDLSLGFKGQFFKWGPQRLAAGLQIDMPTGTREKLLSDESIVLRLFVPFDWDFLPQWTWHVTGHYAFWTNGTRLSFLDTDGQPLFLNSYQKRHVIFIETSLGFWLEPLRGGQGLLIEGGVRGENNFSKQPEDTEGKRSIFPYEWNVGATWFRNEWSYNVQGGSSLGPGISAPLLRLIAGIRYKQKILDFDSQEPKPKGEEATYVSKTRIEQVLSTSNESINYEIYNDQVSYLKLLTREGVIEVGVLQFEFNSAQLTPQAKETVRNLYNLLLELNPKTVHIEGHTDSVGSFQYNLQLSRRRAESVKNELNRLGFRKPITTEGHAWKYPIASNATKEGRAQNRRIEIAIDGLKFRSGKITKREEILYRKWNFPGGRPATSELNDKSLE